MKAVTLISVLIILAVTLLASANVSKREVVPPPSRGALDAHWRMSRLPEESDQLHFYVMLRTGKEGLIKQTATEVSNPQSPRYRKYLTREELFAMAAAPPGIEEAVANWIRSMSGDEPLNLVSYGDAIKVSTTVRNAENVLDTTFQVYSHKKSGHQIIRSDRGVRLPLDVAQHVGYVMGVSEFTLPIKITPSFRTTMRASQKSVRVSPQPVITPSLLKTSYNASTLPSSVTQATNRQGVAAFNDYYSLEALRQFESAFSLPQATVTNTGPASDCTPTCDQVESDLDVQYITAMGTGAETIFRAYPGNAFTAELAMDLANPSVVPSSQMAFIYSISYGLDEIGNEAYIGASEIQMAKLSTIGITVFVSSGDDGALGTDASNCPLDTSNYCIRGGCTHSTTSCGGFIVSKGGNQCIFPTGYVPGDSSRTSAGCSAVASSALTGASFNEWVANQGSCTIAVESDNSGLYWFYSSCACASLTSFTSSTGYHYTPYTFNLANGPALIPGYPATSEWTTAVGATQFVGSAAPYTELAASVLNAPSSTITSGGGFSGLITRPSWQDTAVSLFLTNNAGTLPPSTVFNLTGRAYPDISFNGHLYVIYANTFNGGSTCSPFCNSTFVDGTSASSPSVAGLFTLINEALLSKGQPSLGFLNPLLYTMAASDPSTFFDITSGNNRASENFACVYGYDAVTGWDPVTGLGSPNFANIYAYIVANGADGSDGTDGSDGSDGTNGNSSGAAALENWLSTIYH